MYDIVKQIKVVKQQKINRITSFYGDWRYSRKLLYCNHRVLVKMVQKLQGKESRLLLPGAQNTKEKVYAYQKTCKWGLAVHVYNPSLGYIVRISLFSSLPLPSSLLSLWHTHTHTETPELTYKWTFIVALLTIVKILKQTNFTPMEFFLIILFWSRECYHYWKRITVPNIMSSTNRIIKSRHPQEYILHSSIYVTVKNKQKITLIEDLIEEIWRVLMRRRQKKVLLSTGNVLYLGSGNRHMNVY